MNEKRLYRSNVNKKLFGVCGGIGEYFDINPTVIRIIFLVLVLGFGTGLLAYFIAALIMPKAPE